MKIHVPTENGYLADKFSKYATVPYVLAGFSIHSFPISITDIPQGTVALALTFIDYDAVPVSGCPWIHWIASYLNPACTEITAGISRTDATTLIEGKNSAMARSTNEQLINGYVGPAPPDRDHEYLLTMYALSTKCNLPTGFYLNELYKTMRGHVLEVAELIILGKC